MDKTKKCMKSLAITKKYTFAEVFYTNYIAALFKGQKLGEISPNSRDLKITTPPQKIQDGVSPIYVLGEGTNYTTLYKCNIQIVSSASYVEETVLFLV